MCKRPARRHGYPGHLHRQAEASPRLPSCVDFHGAGLPLLIADDVNASSPHQAGGVWGASQRGGGPGGGYVCSGGGRRPGWGAVVSAGRPDGQSRGPSRRRRRAGVAGRGGLGGISGIGEGVLFCIWRLLMESKEKQETTVRSWAQSTQNGGAKVPCACSGVPHSPSAEQCCSHSQFLFLLHYANLQRKKGAGRNRKCRGEGSLFDTPLQLPLHPNPFGE